MSKFSKTALVLGGLVLIAGTATVAMAQAAPQTVAQNLATPKGWNYEIKNGQRVPKGNRVTNADGSWREEQRQGNCSTVKEKTASGEYKETRQCTPQAQ
jgi:hypothetical protein